ncbi:Rid family hydrolase [Sinorhizobium meliloti]|uniref:Rid family hydrolase n=1 Tax=Rhizobium meliloti TaxID=382 RepID=UPI00398930CA
MAAEAGTNLATTVKTTVLITDMSKFGALNEEYATFFKAPFPARACFEVSALKARRSRWRRCWRYAVLTNNLFPKRRWSSKP